MASSVIGTPMSCGMGLLPLAVLAGLSGVLGSACGSATPSATAHVAIQGITSTLTAGDSAQLTVVSTVPAEGKHGAAQTAWQSSDTSVATVSAQGVVSIVGTGPVDVSATIRGVTGSVHVVVPAVTSVAVTGVRNPMAIGDTEQLHATAYLSNNLQKDLTTRVAWAPGDPGVFSLSSAGLLTAVGKGLTDVRATYQGAVISTRAVVDQPGCTYQVSSVFSSFYRGAHSGESKVTTQPGCAWTVTPDVDWVTITATGGVGSGSFSYSVPFVDGPLVMDPRVGHAMVRWDSPTAGQNVQVTQTSDCRLAEFGAIDPKKNPSNSFGADGGDGHLEVTVNGVFTGRGTDPWQIASTVDWISVAGWVPGKWYFGANFDDVHFTVSSNPGAAARVGTIVACDKTWTVTQAGR